MEGRKAVLSAGVLGQLQIVAIVVVAFVEAAAVAIAMRWSI